MESYFQRLSAYFILHQIDKEQSCKTTGNHGTIHSGEKLVAVLSLGYGENPGVSHKSKSISELSNYTDGMPEWFKAGLEAAMLAPTAMNQQKF